MLKQKIKVPLNDCGESDLLTLAEEIKNMRKGEGVSQQELAQMMLRDRSGLSKIESAQILPTLQTLSDIANALGYNLSLTFEKETTEEIEDEEIIRKIYMTEDREMLEILITYLEAYDNKMSATYESDDEVFYYKNRLNYDYSVNLTNDADAYNKNRFKIYLYNPSESHIYTADDWYFSTYISISSTSEKGYKIFNMEFVKGDEYDSHKKVLHTFTANTPMNVIVAAENIRKSFLEGKDISSVDITDMNALKVQFNEEIKPLDLSENIEYIRVINQIETYNLDVGSRYEIYYEFIRNKYNDGSAWCMSINYKNNTWTCTSVHDYYELRRRKYNSQKVEKNLEAKTPEEVVDIILKYS